MQMGMPIPIGRRETERTKPGELGANLALKRFGE